MGYSCVSYQHHLPYQFLSISSGEQASNIKTDMLAALIPASCDVGSMRADLNGYISVFHWQFMSHSSITIHLQSPSNSLQTQRHTLRSNSVNQRRLTPFLDSDQPSDISDSRFITCEVEAYSFPLSNRVSKANFGSMKQTHRL